MASTTVEHRVKSGEPLSSIARRYKVTVEVLSLNNGITDIHRLWVGQVLKIPKERQSSPSPLPKVLTHRVLAGETLSKISQRHSVTVEALAKSNGIRDPNRIGIGLVLKIPQESQPPPSPAPSPQTPSTKASSSKASSTKAFGTKASGIQVPKTAPYDAGKPVCSFGRVRNDDGVNLRETPKPDGAMLKKLPFNTRVFVSHELPGD